MIQPSTELSEVLETNFATFHSPLSENTQEAQIFMRVREFTDGQTECITTFYFPNIYYAKESFVIAKKFDFKTGPDHGIIGPRDFSYFEGPSL